MEEECDKIQFHVETNGQSLIDFSSENDELVLDLSSPLAASSGGFNYHQSSEHQKEPRNFCLLGPKNAGKEAGLTPCSDQDEQYPGLTEYSEPESARRKGKCNLRKSLAWDSAFFTSAGVLDPEELSSMIKGPEKSEKPTLPGIQEDIRGSTDSISTLASDNLTLENLEVELFEDIRASIQKSNRVFNATSLNGKATSGDCQLNSTLEDLSSKNQMKPRPASKKLNGISKPQTKPPIRMQGPSKAVKKDSVHSKVTQSFVQTGGSTSTLPKPPRIVDKGKPISTVTSKNTYLGASQASKIENAKIITGVGTGIGAQASKVPVISGARRGLRKSLSSSKSSSLGSSTLTKCESARSSLSDSSGSLSSDHTSKSHMAAARRKIDDRTVNPISGSTLKTPSKTAPKNRSMGNSVPSAYLMSSKLSSSISPASSISEWSSASSSSSSIINQRSDKSRTSFGNSSCKSVDNDTVHLDLNNHPNNQILDGDEIEVIAVCNASTRRSSTQTGTLSRPASMKPSCLRMPSPKIGFFDGVKSVRTPNGTMQSHASLPTSYPKVSTAVSSPCRSSNMKLKMAKLPHARASSAFANIKPGTQKPASPMSSQEKLHASVKFSNASNDGKGCHSSSLEVYDEISQESCLKVEEVGGEGPRQASHGSGAGFGEGVNENLGIPSAMDGVAGLKTTPEVTSGTCDSNSKCDENLRPPDRVDKDGKGGQNDLKSDPLAPCRIVEKENDVSREPVDEFNRNQGHVNPNICNIGDGHPKDKLEPASVSFSPTILKNVSRTPLIVMNSPSDSPDFPKEPAAIGN